MTLTEFNTPRGNVVQITMNAMNFDFWLDSEAEEEHYCLDAPSRIPAGSTFALNGHFCMSSYCRREQIK